MSSTTENHRAEQARLAQLRAARDDAFDRLDELRVRELSLQIDSIERDLDDDDAGGTTIGVGNGRSVSSSRKTPAAPADGGLPDMSMSFDGTTVIEPVLGPRLSEVAESTESKAPPPLPLGKSPPPLPEDGDEEEQPSDTPDAAPATSTSDDSPAAPVGKFLIEVPEVPDEPPADTPAAPPLVQADDEAGLRLHERLLGFSGPWATSLALHLLAMILLGVWLLPVLLADPQMKLSAVFQLEEGERTIEHLTEATIVAEEDDRQQMLQSVQPKMPDMMDEPNVDLPALATSVSVSQPMLEAMLEKTDFTQKVPLFRRRNPGGTGQDALLARAESAEGAVDRITMQISELLEDDDTLVIWAFDTSTSLIGDRKRVAARLEPFFDEIGERKDSGYKLLSAAVAFGAGTQEIIGPTTRNQRIARSIVKLPVDESGKENVFTCINYCVEKYRRRFKGNVMIVVWTDESGNDPGLLEGTISHCRAESVSVSVVGPTAVLGSEKAQHVWHSPGSNIVFMLSTDRGPDTAVLERIKLPYWFSTEMPAFTPHAARLGGVGGHDPLWYGGRHLDAIVSGFSPWPLTRLTLETGGTFTILDRPDERGPFDFELMKPYLPDYRPQEIYLAEIQASELRRAIMQSVVITRTANLQLPPMQFFGDADPDNPAQFVAAYYTPADFQRKLREEMPKLRKLLVAQQQVIEEALKPFGAEMELEFLSETSPRWRAWYDLTRGRLLAYSARLAEYRIFCDLLIQPGMLGGQTNYIALMPSSDVRGGESVLQRSAEAERHLKRCLEQHAQTPWAYLAQRELDHPIGIGLRQLTLQRQPATPRRPGSRPQPPNL